MPLFKKRKNGTLILDKKAFKSHLKRILGTTPYNLRIYEMALIHRSATITLPDSTKVNNERLEFLGDSILNSIISDWLFEKFPSANEGFLTKLRSKIVNRDFINELSIKMGIDKILVANLPRANNPRNICGNALEALLGAVFIDRGYNVTKRIFVKHIAGKFIDIEKITSTDNDYKSLVFEWTQKRKMNLSFITEETSEPGLKGSFFSSLVLINDAEFGRGQGASKKEAEQDAALRTWEKLNSPA